MAGQKTNIAEKIMQIAEPVAEQAGCSIWDVFYGKEGQGMVLRITIDKPEGVGITDCETVSRNVDPLIDEADIIQDAYSFEVSSPGLGRKISKDGQFEKYIGKEVIVHLFRADENGSRDYNGILKEFSKENVTITADCGEKTFKRESISYVKADDDK